jgi:hypothetical protein
MLNRDPDKLTLNRKVQKRDQPVKNRQYVMSETTRVHLLSELRHLQPYVLSTPDTEASLKSIREVLERMGGA